MFINHVIYSLIEMRGNFVLYIFLKNKTGKGVSFLLSTSLIIKKEVHCDFIKLILQVTLLTFCYNSWIMVVKFLLLFTSFQHHLKIFSFKIPKIVSEKRDETPYHLLKGEWPKFAKCGYCQPNDFEERENASSLRQQQQ